MELEKMNGDSGKKDILYPRGGVAPTVLEAGSVLSNATVRRRVMNDVSAVLPQLPGKLGLNFSDAGTDIERCMKLGTM